MNKRDFERELWLAVQGYWGDRNWKDKRGRDYTWVMDDLVRDTDAEQWLVVDLTLDMVHDPNFIVGEVSCNTPVSPNEWVIDFDTPLNTPVTGYQKPVSRGWWFCIEDMIPQQMATEQATNYTGPFASEREAFIAVLKKQDATIDQLVAELNALRPTQSTEYQLP